MSFEFQLCNLAKKIVHSPTIRADLEAACIRSKIPPGQMVRDVATRWNSTAELIGRAIELREALKFLVIMQEHNKPRGVRLKRFQLSSEEWSLLTELFPLLEVSLLRSPSYNRLTKPILFMSGILICYEEDFTPRCSSHS